MLDAGQDGGQIYKRLLLTTYHARQTCPVAYTFPLLLEHSRRYNVQFAKMATLDSPIWRFLEKIYPAPNPPPRVREKPMQVLCVGLPRSGTESLQKALLRLGYDYTYHVRS